MKDFNKSGVFRMEEEIKSISLEEEFKKNPECPKENFEILKEWLMVQDYLPKITDQKLFQFMFSCFYDIEKTKKCIHTFYTVKTKSPELYKNRDIFDPDLKKAFNVTNVFTLPQLTPKRYRITYLSLRSPDPAVFDFVNTVKLFLMAYDTALHINGTARGHVIVFDLKNVGFRHIMKCSMDTWKKIIRLTQEALPVRKKTLHILNTGYFVYKFVQVLKPFILPEVFHTLHLHRENDLDEFYKFVPRECLPVEHGGPLESVEVYSKNFEEELKRLRNFFDEDDQLVIKNEII